mgnify:CR=1 FL=1
MIYVTKGGEVVKQTIILVDGDSLYRNLIKLCLEKHYFSVVDVKNGRQALAAVEKYEKYR